MKTLLEDIKYLVEDYGPTVAFVLIVTALVMLAGGPNEVASMLGETLRPLYAASKAAAADA